MKKWIAGIVILSVVGLWANNEISSYHTPTIISVSTKLLPEPNAKFDFSSNEIQPIKLSYASGQLAPNERKNIEGLLEPLVAHLKDHNQKIIDILGSHLSEESKIEVGGCSNFGEARARYIKRALVNANIARSRISIHGHLLNPNSEQFPIQIQLGIDPELKN